MPELAWLPLVGVLIVIASAFTLLISPNWRASLAALTVQYLGIFILISTGNPFQLALAKLVTGLMAVAVLGMSISGLFRQGEFSFSDSTPLAGEAPETPRTPPGTRVWQVSLGASFSPPDRITGCNGGVFNRPTTNGMGTGSEQRASLGECYPAGRRITPTGFHRTTLSHCSGTTNLSIRF